ncbi:hypothetical protein D3C73_1088630 [compost metagenome]
MNWKPIGRGSRCSRRRAMKCASATRTPMVRAACATGTSRCVAAVPPRGPCSNRPPPTSGKCRWANAMPSCIKSSTSLPGVSWSMAPWPQLPAPWPCRHGTACDSSSPRNFAISARKAPRPSMATTSSTVARYTAPTCISMACCSPPLPGRRCTAARSSASMAVRQ